MRIILISIFTALGLSCAFSQPSGYGFAKTITIKSSEVEGSSSLINFPMLLSITDADLRTTGNGGKLTSSQGFDIVFTDEDCTTLLDHQIELYSPSSGEIVMWIRIPSLPSNVDKQINMYYGNNTVSTDPSSTSTWDSNFLGVWHMSEDPGGSAPQILDYSAGASNGTVNGGMGSLNLVSGKCGQGLEFDGVDDYVEIGDLLINGLENLTVEAWINTSSLANNSSPSGHNANEGAIVHKSGSSDDNLGLTVSTGGTTFYLDNGGDRTLTDPLVPTNTWVHIACTWDNSNMRIFQDGQLRQTLSGISSALVTNSNTLRFGGVHGAGGGNPYSFDGLIDEIKISNLSRSAEWIETEYNNQDSPSNFYTLSMEMPASSLCPPLPVELNSFEAIYLPESSVKLIWNTQSEVANDQFLIERSDDLLTWKTIGIIAGAGYSDVVKKYTFIDRKPIQGLNYYRLKQVDYNGEYEFSPIVTANVKFHIKESLDIYPNPTFDEVFVRIDSPDLGKLRILDARGGNLSELVNTTNIDAKTISVDLSKLQKGIYFLKLGNQVSRLVKH